MKPYPWGKLHEIAHGRIDEPSPCRCRHVDVGIQDHGSTRAVNNAAVDAGDMVQILVGDTKGSSRREVAWSSGRDGRLHDCSIMVQEVNLLFCKIELDRVLSVQRTPQADEGK